MEYRKEVFECSREELVRELVARGARLPEKQRFDFQDKNGTQLREEIMADVKTFYREVAGTLEPDKSLSHISTPELVKVFLFKIGRITIGNQRGVWGYDERKDLFDVNDPHVIANANSVAAICSKDDLIDNNDGYMELRVKHYGTTYNLCDCEPFYCQPVASGLLKSCFLVKENVVATAAHCIKCNIQDHCFLFGYQMLNPFNPVTRVPKENIYYAAELVKKSYTTRQLKKNGSDWALVKLDRKVSGQAVAEISQEDIYYGQPIYVIGHPAGLPKKYAPGSRVKFINKTNFIAELDIYSGNSGSPVFESDNHKVVGLVIHGDGRDFIWTGSCYASAIYPRPDSNSVGSRCTRSSEFKNYCT